MRRARRAGAIAQPGFDLVVDRADRFERRIGWLGCSQVPAGAAGACTTSLVDACSARGVPMRRENHVHAARHRAARSRNGPSRTRSTPLQWRVRGFALMASAEGAYEVLGSWPLQPA